MKGPQRSFVLTISLVLTILPSFPLALGDGTALYYEFDRDQTDPYGVTFESRQLAMVTLLGEDRQRIDLFLSIFSLEPGRNMTVIIPMREVPLDVSVRSTSDSDFLEDIKLEEIRKESELQDMSHARTHFIDGTKEAISMGAISSSFGPFGLFAYYIAKEYRLVESVQYHTSRETGGGGGGTGDFSREVERLNRYDLEGMSITVYSVGINATLEDLLSSLDILDPPQITKEVLDRYRGHFAVTIDCKTVPPIPEKDFGMLMDLMPATMKELALLIKEKRLTQKEIVSVCDDFAFRGFRELVDSGRNMTLLLKKYDYPGPDYYGQSWVRDYYDDPSIFKYHWSQPFDLGKHLWDMLHVVYGFSNFKGSVITIETELDDGKMFFPLGTSDGWSNSISQTVVVLKTPKELSLKCEPEHHRSAFIDDHRYYMFAFRDENPGTDITGSQFVTPGEDERGARNAEMFHKMTPIAVSLISVVLQVLLWTFCLMIIWMLRKGIKGTSTRPLTIRSMGFGILSIVLSAPLVFFFFFYKPGLDMDFSKKEANMVILLHTFVMFYAINIVLVVAGVVV